MHWSLTISHCSAHHLRPFNSEYQHIWIMQLNPHPGVSCLPSHAGILIMVCWLQHCLSYWWKIKCGNANAILSSRQGLHRQWGKENNVNTEEEKQCGDSVTRRGEGIKSFILLFYSCTWANEFKGVCVCFFGLLSKVARRTLSERLHMHLLLVHFLALLWWEFKKKVVSLLLKKLSTQRPW